MKILHIINAFYPPFHAGGAVTVAYNMCKFLAKKEHDVTVFTTNVRQHRSLFKPEQKPRLLNGIKIFYFKNDAYKPSAHLYFSTQLIHALRETLSKYDVVHLHEYRAITSLATAYYAWKSKTPFVLQAHGQLPTWTAKSTVKSTFDLMFGHRLLNDAAKVIATTKTEAEQYKAMNVPSKKIEVIPNVIDLAEFPHPPSKGAFRKKFSVGNEEKIVLYLGRIHQIKGLDILLKAFASVAGKIEKVKLTIVGPDDGYLSELKVLAKALNIEDKVMILGPLYGEEKLEAYVDADVYVLPSKYEVWGMTAVEAVGCSTPVILTENCGVAEYLKDKVGLVVKHDQDALRQALQEMLSNNEKQQAFRSNCRVVIQDFDVSRVVPKLEKVYENMLTPAIKDLG
jgi:glycosyltransferase involved in cell wall biosynthesis